MTEPWTQDDEEEFATVSPLAAHAQLLDPVDIHGTPEGQDADLDSHSAIADALLSFTPGAQFIDPSSGDRVRRRVERIWREAIANPADAVLGAAQGATMGHLDDVLALGAEHPLWLASGGLLSGLDQWLADPEVGQEIRGAVGDASDLASDRSPHAYGTGDEAGATLASFALPEVPLAEGTGALVRAGVRGLEGAGLLGGLEFADAEGDIPERLEQAAPSALAGFGMGVGGSVVSSALGAGGRAVRRRGEAAPEAYLAAVRGEGSLAPSRMRDFGDLGSPERARAYETLRTEVPIRPWDTPRSLHERSSDAYEQSYARSQGIRDDFEQAGGLIPYNGVAAEMNGVADDYALNPIVDEMGVPDRIRSVAGRVQRQPDVLRARGIEPPVHTPAEHPPQVDQYGGGIREFEDYLYALGEGAFPEHGGQRVPIPRRVQQEMYSRMRGIADDEVARTLSGETSERFADERLRTQALRRMRDQASDAVERTAAHVPGGQMAAQIGATIGGATGSPIVAGAGSMLGRLGGRALRPSRLARQAWVADVAQRLSTGAIPRALERWAPAFERAITRGPEAIALVLHVLEQTDPEFSAAVDEGAAEAPDIEEMDESDAPDIEEME